MEDKTLYSHHKDPNRSFPWRKLLGVVLVMIAMTGLAYPLIGEYLNERFQSEITSVYSGEASYREEDQIGNHDTEQAYVLGFLQIPKLDLYLAIFEGTEEKELMEGVGHVASSATPGHIGSGHVILCGHSGMRRAKLFTDLEQMEYGDKFFLYVGEDILTYEVDSIETLLPAEAEQVLSNAVIKAEKDQVTLMTCTPYGVNSHRLLVTGTRKAEAIGKAEIKSEETKSIGRVSTWQRMYLKGIAGGVIGIVLLMIAYSSYRCCRWLF